MLDQNQPTRGIAIKNSKSDIPRNVRAPSMTPLPAPRASLAGTGDAWHTHASEISKNNFEILIRA